MERSLRPLGGGIWNIQISCPPQMPLPTSCSCTYNPAMVGQCCTLYICCGQWLLLPDPWRSVVGYQTEGSLQCGRWMCFHIYQVIPKQKWQEIKLLFLFFPSVLSSELSRIYSHTNNQLPAMVSPISEVLRVYLQYPFLPCPMVQSHK